MFDSRRDLKPLRETGTNDTGGINLEEERGTTSEEESEFRAGDTHQANRLRSRRADRDRGHDIMRRMTKEDN